MDVVTRINISAAGAGRFKVELAGEIILASARDPEHEAARELVARGVTGRFESYVNGTRSMIMDVEKAAGRSVSDGAASALRIVAWRPFAERVSDIAVSCRTVHPSTAEIAEAVV